MAKIRSTINNPATLSDAILKRYDDWMKHHEHGLQHNGAEFRKLKAETNQALQNADLAVFHSVIKKHDLQCTVDAGLNVFAKQRNKAIRNMIGALDKKYPEKLTAATRLEDGAGLRELQEAVNALKNELASLAATATTEVKSDGDVSKSTEVVMRPGVKG